MTPEQFDRELRRLAAQAWDSGFSSGLDFASNVIAGHTPIRSIPNPYLEQSNVADDRPE